MNPAQVRSTDANGFSSGQLIKLYKHTETAALITGPDTETINIHIDSAAVYILDSCLFFCLHLFFHKKNNTQNDQLPK